MNLIHLILWKLGRRRLWVKWFTMENGQTLHTVMMDCATFNDFWIRRHRRFKMWID